MRRIPDNASVLDIGTYDGRLFDVLGLRLGSGVGVDPRPARTGEFGNVVMKRGEFPDIDVEGPFDCICMLAVIEHVPRERHEAWADACARLLKPSGRLIVTIPAPIGDPIYYGLIRLRLIKGIDLENPHYGLRPSDIARVFSSRLKLIEWRRFELGLNNILVFER